MKTHLLFIWILFFLFSCKKEFVQDKKIIELSAFTKIELNAPFDVYLMEDSVFSISIEGDENTIQSVSAEVKENKLIVEDNRKTRWLSPNRNKISLYIRSKPLEEVKANETCNIQTLSPITSSEFGLILGSKANAANLELNCDVFYYWNSHPCGGNVTLRGTVNELKIWNFALMSVDAKNLVAKKAIVENHAKGNCEIQVLNQLNYSIYGIGDILLSGNPPEINENTVNSSGKLIKY